MIHSAEEFIRLRTSADPAEYLRAATDGASMEVWQEVITHHADMRSWVAHNKTVPVEVPWILASDPDTEVRSSVAMKNKLPSALMLQLASDEDESVRRRVAYNKNAPVEALRTLAADNCLDIAEERLAELD